MDGKKIAIISVSSVALLTGGYFLYKAINRMIAKKKEEEEISDSSKSSSNYAPSSSGGNKPASSGSGTTLASTPFKNKTEGNAFRKWINEKYPAYAKEIDLSLSGPFNNSNIQKAWAKYGAEYTSNPNATPTPTPQSSNWSATDKNAQKELYDRLDDLNVDVDYRTYNVWEWDVTNGYPTVYLQVYKDGLLVLEKQANVYGGRYAKESGTWKKTANGWQFTFKGKTYNAPYSGSDLLNTLWGLMKDANYFKWSDSTFVYFDSQMNRIKKRNKTQTDILENGYESLM